MKTLKSYIIENKRYNHIMKENGIPISLKRYIDMYQYKFSKHSLVTFLLYVFLYIVLYIFLFMMTRNKVYFLISKKYIGDNIIPIIISTIGIFALNNWAIAHLDEYNSNVISKNKILRALPSFKSRLGNKLSEMNLLYPLIPFLTYPFVRKYLSRTGYNNGLIIWQISLILIILMIVFDFFVKVSLKQDVKGYLLNKNSYLTKKFFNKSYKLLKKYIIYNKNDTSHSYKIYKYGERDNKKNNLELISSSYQALYDILVYKVRINKDNDTLQRIRNVYNSLIFCLYKYGSKFNSSERYDLMNKNLKFIRAYYVLNKNLLCTNCFEFSKLGINDNYILPKGLYNNLNNRTGWDLLNMCVLSSLETSKYSFHMIINDNNNINNAIVKNSLKNFIKEEEKYIKNNSDNYLINSLDRIKREL